MLIRGTALVVEAEFLIALDIQRMLEAIGIAHTLFARTAAEAEQLRPHWSELVVAIVELPSDLAPTQRLIDKLEADGIPIVLTSADLTVPSLGQGQRRPVLVKPIPEASMASAVEQALAARLE